MLVPVLLERTSSTAPKLLARSVMLLSPMPPALGAVASNPMPLSEISSTPLSSLIQICLALACLTVLWAASWAIRYSAPLTSSSTSGSSGAVTIASSLYRAKASHRVYVALPPNRLPRVHLGAKQITKFSFRQCRHRRGLWRTRGRV